VAFNEQLRPEAQALGYDDLNHAQVHALGKIIRLLYAAVCRLDQHDKSPQDFALLHGNTHQIMFLSGVRGSGKTTVYLSLRHACQTPELWCGHKQLNTDLQPMLHTLHSRLLWLQPIDIELLLHPSFFLCKILARIDDETSSKNAQQDLLSANNAYQDALNQLMQFKNDVALSWPGNLLEQRANLSPDAYSMALMRWEQGRLSITQRFCDVLDGLARHAFQGHSVQQPLFLLPIDDFDLNPSCTKTLLNILRTISVPRFFCLALGDVQVAEQMIGLEISGRITRLSQQANKNGLLYPAAKEVNATTGSLTATAIRKLIPQGQRIELKILTIDESLHFSPPRTHADTIETLMRNISLEKTCLSRSISIFDFLFPSPPTLAGGWHTPPQPDNPAKYTPYAGQYLFQAPPRRIMDHWFALLTLSQREPDPTQEFELELELELELEIAHFLVKEIQRHLKEQPIDGATHQSITDSFTPHGFNLRASGLVVVDHQPVTNTLRLTHATLVLRDPAPLALALPAQNGQTSIVIKRETASYFILLHDLATFASSNDDVTHSPVPARLNWASTRWPIGLLDTLHLSWAVPNWPDFRRMDRFGWLWTELKSKIDPDKPQHYYYAWFCAFTALYAESLPNKDFTWSLPSALTKTALVQSIRPILKENSVDSWKWLIASALLFSPECGCETEWCNSIITLMSNHWQTKDIARAIRHKRAKRLHAFQSKNALISGLSLIVPNAIGEQLQASLALLRLKLVDLSGLLKWPLALQEAQTLAGLNDITQTTYLADLKATLKRIESLEILMLSFIIETKGQLSEEVKRLSQLRFDECQGLVKRIQRELSEQNYSLLNDQWLAFGKQHPLNQLGDGLLCPSAEEYEPLLPTHS